MNSIKQKNKHNILVVDDNEDIITILKDQLKGVGFNVVSASDGQEAMSKLKNQDFSLIITDLNMPKKDGIKLANEVFSMSQIPVLLMTGELESFEVRLKSLKNVMLLPKPFNPEVVSMLVKKIINERAKEIALAS